MRGCCDYDMVGVLAMFQGTGARRFRVGVVTKEVETRDTRTEWFSLFARIEGCYICAAPSPPQPDPMCKNEDWPGRREPGLGKLSLRERRHAEAHHERAEKSSACTFKSTTTQLLFNFQNLTAFTSRNEIYSEKGGPREDFSLTPPHFKILFIYFKLVSWP